MTKRMAIGVAMLLALLALGGTPAFANEGTLAVQRSADRLSATATWTPSQGAEHQIFLYVGKLLPGEEDVFGIGVNFDAYMEFELAGDVSTLTMSGLDPARDYIYIVARADRNSRGKWVLSDWDITGVTLGTSVATDREALVALYNATDGVNWRQKTNWLSSAPMGEWYGVETDEEGRVVELNLWLNKLEGELPPELGNLAKLERLNLLLNKVSGSIPSELGMLFNLEELILMGNKLTGVIPIEMGSLVNLEKMFLSSGNQFTGCIPRGLRDVAVNDFSELGLEFCS